MKICFVSGNISRSGGTERVSTLVANELFRRGHCVEFLSIWPGKKSFFPLAEGIRIRVAMDHKIKAILYNIPVIRAIIVGKILKAADYDIIICVDTALCTLVQEARKGTKSKLIAWEHFNYEHTMTDAKRMHALKIAKDYADKIVVLTKADYEMHIRCAGIPEQKMAQIYNPISFTTNLKPDMSKKRVIAVGRLTSQKGFDILLNIWSIVEKKQPDWTLEILGEGELKNALKEQCEKLDLKRVVFSPKTADVAKHYHESSIYAMTSRYEGFPMVLLEGTAMGLPLIAFDCKTGPSEMIEDGVNGYLINMGDEETYASKLLRLMTLQDIRERMSLASKKVARRFTVQAIVDKWEKLLKEL